MREPHGVTCKTRGWRSVKGRSSSRVRTVRGREGKGWQVGCGQLTMVVGLYGFVALSRGVIRFSRWEVPEQED